MTPLPQLSGQECIQALKKAGFNIVRRHGSHVILRKEAPFTQVVVPDHKTLDRGTLRGIIRQAGLSVEEFVNLI